MSHQCRMDAQKSADQSLPGTASSPPHQPAAHIACPCCQSSEGFTRDHTNQFLFLIKPIPAVCWRKRRQKGLPYIVIFWKEAVGEDLHHVVGLWGKPEMKKAAHQSAKTPLQHRHASPYSQAGTRGDTLQNPNFSPEPQFPSSNEEGRRTGKAQQANPILQHLRLELANMEILQPSASNEVLGKNKGT